MEAIAILPLMGCFIAAVVLLGRWVLGPIDRAAKSRQAPVQYLIADFLCLFVIIQIPLAAAHQFSGKDERGYFWFFTVLTWIAAPVIWFAATQALSKAGIPGGVARLAFMGLVVPLAYYGLLPFVVMTLAIPIAIFAPDGDNPFNNRWVIATWAALGILLCLAGLYTRRMVRRVELNARWATDDDFEETPASQGSSGQP